jgi:hypothetical protein
MGCKCPLHRFYLGRTQVCRAYTSLIRCRGLLAHLQHDDGELSGSSSVYCTLVVTQGVGKSTFLPPSSD